MGGPGGMFVGFTNPSGFNGGTRNFFRKGSYHFGSHDGRLYEGTGSSYRTIGNGIGALPEGTFIKCELDRAASTISFLVDGARHPAMFESIGQHGLVPCVEFYG